MAFGGVWKESLTELSGGQKSLLALSLILAMLLFKPAPIYILDEVGHQSAEEQLRWREGAREYSSVCESPLQAELSDAYQASKLQWLGTQFVCIRFTSQISHAFPLPPGAGGCCT